MRRIKTVDPATASGPTKVLLDGVKANLAALRAAGFGDGEIVEIIAHVGINTFTNYFNHIAETEIEFPAVSAAAAARAA